MQWTNKVFLWGGLAAFLCLCCPPVHAADPFVADGLIEPHQVVEIGSSVPGILETVAAERGDSVKTGQVVATLQSGVEKATLALARARAELITEIRQRREQLAFMTRKQERFKQLFENKAVPYEKMDEAETDRILAEHALQQAIESQQIAKLEMRRAAAVLEQRTIKSTINGVVVERFMSPGEYVEDRPVLKIAQIDPLNVEVILGVELLGSVHEGMRAQVIPQEPVGGAYPATVKVVDKVVDAASGTFGVRLELPNPRHRISAGLKCSVDFATE